MLSLVRAVTGAIDDGESLQAALTDQIARFAQALRELAEMPQPWPEPIVRDAARTARDAIDHATAQRVDRSPAIASILRAGGRDLLALTRRER